MIHDSYTDKTHLFENLICYSLDYNNHAIINISYKYYLTSLLKMNVVKQEQAWISELCMEELEVSLLVNQLTDLLKEQMKL